MFVQTLSKSNICPDIVQPQNLICLTKYILSRFCPNPKFVQTLSILLYWHNILLDRVWTNSGSECPISVQALDDGQSLDRHLTKFVLFLDRHCTWTTIGQSLDRDWTKFGQLDKVWTETGQSLDFMSNVCLTT